MTIRRMHLVISNVRAWLHKDAHCGILSVRVSTTLAPFCYLLLRPAGPHGLILFRPYTSWVTGMSLHLLQGSETIPDGNIARVTPQKIFWGSEFHSSMVCTAYLPQPSHRQLFQKFASVLPSHLCTQLYPTRRLLTVTGIKPIVRSRVASPL